MLSQYINASVQNIHFIYCSDKVTVIEMAEPIVDELIFLESLGVVCYNGFLNCDVLVLACITGAMYDNPQAFELNHATSVANKNYCKN